MSDLVASWKWIGRGCVREIWETNLDVVQVTSLLRPIRVIYLRHRELFSPIRTKPTYGVRKHPVYICITKSKKQNKRTDDSKPHRYTSRSHSPAPSSRTSTAPPSSPNASAPRPSGRTRRGRRCRRRRSPSSLALRLSWVAGATSLFGVRVRKDRKRGISIGDGYID